MAIPKPEPSDWQIANAQELRATDREVLAMLRDSRKRVDAELKALVDANRSNISDGVKRARLEQSRLVLMREQALIFEQLGNVVSARRLRAAIRAQRLSAAADAALLTLVGRGKEAAALYAAALHSSQAAVDVALQRMRYSAVPLAQRIYNTGVWMNGRLQRLINQTLATGLNAREFAKQARDWFNPNTPGGVRYAAMRLARTEINNAFHSMSVQKAADKPWVDKMDWNLSKSHPTPDICNKVAEASPYPADRVPARPHPQCMCYVTEREVDEDEWIERFLTGEFDDYLDKEMEKEDARQNGPGANGGSTGRRLQGADSQRAAKPKRTSPAAFEKRLAKSAEGKDALAAATFGLERYGSPLAFSAPLRQAVNRYTGSDYREVNAALRDPAVEADERTQEIIRGLDAAMALSSLSKEVVAYRGMHNAQKIFGDRIENDLTGLEWREDAFVSTTASEKKVRGFLGSLRAQHRVVMRILLPEGTPAVEASPMRTEAEILLGRGQTFRVVRDNGFDEQGIRRLDVELTK